MALKNIPDPGFADDDGSADPALAEALSAWSADRGAEPRVLEALRGARLLVPVVALLGEVETGPDGLRREKTSDMAVPTLTAPGGRKALPVFTSTDSLARWREDARPVAVDLARALQAAAHERADTLVFDLAGPVTYPLTGAALRAVAAGRTGGAGPVGEPAVAEAVRAVLAAEPEVAGAHLAPGGRADGTLALRLVPGAPAKEAVARIARALAADAVLREHLVRGLDLALLPPEAELPGEPLFSRTPGR
ncbi:SseB family protein [Streptomyces sp. JJ38]|uniref:SseB family protein n=1 Tax=Streptomyces sp. JJ38 TaxID=2738128 RepID=UPI001C5622D6|nr:SseB family protein [Streptomyces sp. JJ38]MBW1600293.1 SseB family protein [Streptomyces sp. JJ38]